ncbi:hypothetical protein QFC21_003540 [Naganishia friedmannii]|uniref:Uncharacterized protein n=1 Tax=Naganishia friedmannii TaxID=89922 RepID=A0ACC2VNZ6_9TREE|nr:hypothetical protein QFC21_003540 [Naganishia friedmannii]
MSDAQVQALPSVLILGGINTVARHLAVSLCARQGGRVDGRSPLVKPVFSNADGIVIQHLRIVDKYSVQPATTYLDPEFKKCLAELPEIVEYRQLNLTIQSKVEEALQPPQAKGIEKFDYVFDLTGETRYDRPEIIHIQQTYTLPLNIAKHAASLPTALRPSAYIRLTFPFYQMNSSSPSSGYGEAFLPNPDYKKKSKGFFSGGKDKEESFSEGFGMRPDGIRGRWWHEAVRAIGAIGSGDSEEGSERLSFAVVRVGEIYGEGYCDKSQVLGRLVVGHIYQNNKEEMKFLYNPDLRMHTVHVQDVVRSLFTTAQWIAGLGQGEAARVEADRLAGVTIPSAWYRATDVERQALDTVVKRGDMSLNLVDKGRKVVVPYFNVVDEADTTQDTLARSIAALYKIKYGFHGSIVSTLVSQFQKMDFSEMVDDVNEDHMEIWQKMLEQSDPPILDTPISPYLDDHAFRSAYTSAAQHQLNVTLTDWRNSV